ncbi:MAG TPA: hypothetical protein VIP29_01890 [Nitrososphaeraceae archaeon]
MNKFVPVLLVLVIAFAAMQLLTWSIAEAGKKYPKIRADAGDDFKVSENKEVKLDGSDSRGGFKKFTDFEWELVRVNGAKVNNEPFQINNGDEKEASFMAPDVASGEVTYEFKLKVRDEVDREDDDIVKIVVMNQQASVPVPVGPT